MSDENGDRGTPPGRRWPGAKIGDGTDWTKLDYRLSQWLRACELICRAGRLLERSLPGVGGIEENRQVGSRAERVGELLREASATWDEVIAPYFARYHSEPMDPDNPFL